MSEKDDITLEEESETTSQEDLDIDDSEDESEDLGNDDDDSDDNDSDEDESDDSDDEDGNNRYSGKKKKPTVPLHKHLKLKKQLRDLQKRKDNGTLKSGEDLDGALKKIEKQFDLEPGLVTALASVLTTHTSKQSRQEVENILNQQKAKEQEEKGFENEFSKLTDLYPQLTAKKDIIKQLAYTAKYKKSTLEDIALDTFGDFLGKKTAEKGKSAPEKEGGSIDFASMSGEQKDAVLSDPKLSKKYYDWLDKQ